jgi:hypothetical protein
VTIRPDWRLLNPPLYIPRLQQSAVGRGVKNARNPRPDQEHAPVLVDEHDMHRRQATGVLGANRACRGGSSPPRSRPGTLATAPTLQADLQPSRASSLGLRRILQGATAEPFRYANCYRKIVCTEGMCTASTRALRSSQARLQLSTEQARANVSESRHPRILNCSRKEVPGFFLGRYTSSTGDAVRLRCRVFRRAKALARPKPLDRYEERGVEPSFRRRG